MWTQSQCHSDVTFIPDHVLDEGVHVIMQLVHGGHSVNDDVTLAADLVLDLGVHEIMDLVQEGLSVNGDIE